jgi:bifunctional UDP-N-acetylglucosamine pyrophosphorylase/glucosamine-1-phosphate N-acetyltransferase
MRLAVIVLAAGEGIRMKSSYPKVLHEICGQPLIKYVVNEVKKLNPERIIVVVGHRAEKVVPLLDSETELVIQSKQLGTAHAVKVTESKLDDFDGTIMVTCGDTPLIRHETLNKLSQLYKRTKAVATLLSANLSNPAGYGRVVRGPDGMVERIVEEKDASEKEKKICEINSGIYCFKKQELFEAIQKVNCKNVQKEFYLTDVVEILNKAGKKIAVCAAKDSSEILGVNSREELAMAQNIMRNRINDKWMKKGVTLFAPDLIFIGPEVEIGKDTIIHPFSFFEGRTRVGKECHLGPSVHLIDMEVGDRVKMENVVAEGSVIEDEVNLGPFCRLRPGTRVKKGAKIGSYVELKKSEVGEESKVPHLSYIGDTVIGKNVNVGAGTITCNFDGLKKHQTIIEDGAFIGSDTMLVAPVKVGKNAATGAGSTISEDVPDGSLALERSKQKVIKDWSKKRKSKKKSKK